MNIADTIDSAKRSFEVAGRGCLVRMGEDEPSYAKVEEIAARLRTHPDATLLLTAVSEVVERYDPVERRGQRLSATDAEQVRRNPLRWNLLFRDGRL